MKIKGFACSVIGSREMNQDSYLVDDVKNLYCVADGVGGGLKGEVASKMAAEGFAKEAPPEGSLKPTFQILQAAIYKEAMDQFGDALMGTTMTGLRIKGDQATVCHAGDSRCYLYNESVLRQLTEDHEAFDERYQGSVLASYLGIPADVHPLKLQEENFTVVPGNRLLMCSDGLYRQIDDMRMVQMIRSHGNDPQAMLEMMCKEAAKAEHSDNVTVVYVEIEAEGTP